MSDLWQFQQMSSVSVSEAGGTKERKFTVLE